MKQTFSPLRSKLIPVVSAELVDRKRLWDVFAALPDKRLALVVAGAGYGKTTFAAQALDHLGVDRVWYNLDSSDRDISIFLQYLIAGFRELHPEFGGRLQYLLSSTPDVSGRLGHILSAFTAEIEAHVTQKTFIVLDDFHLVQGGADIADAVEFLLHRMPRCVSMMPISRTAPNIRTSGYRIRREVIDVTESDLVFRQDETELLCRQQAPDFTGPETARRINALSGGWAAALMLLCGSMTEEAQADLDTDWSSCISKDRIFEYLEDNVFSRLSQEVQSFMMRTSLLTWLDPAICDRIPGVSNASDILEDLIRHHVLMFPGNAQGQSRRYHHLLQEFLQEQLRLRYSKEEISLLHETIGNIFRERGDFNGALHHYWDAGAMLQMCELVSELTLGDMSSCAPTLMGRILIAVPEEALQRYPRVRHLKARVTSLKGNISAGIQGFRLALQRMEELNDTVGIKRCLKDLGFHYYLTGDVRKAYDEMRRLWEQPDLETGFRGEVGGYLVFFAALLGEFEASDRYRDAALIMVSQSRDSKAGFGKLFIKFCESVRYQMSGDINTSRILTDNIIESLIDAGVELILPIAYVHAALNAYYLGCPEEGMRQVEKGLSIARRIGFEDHQYMWLLYCKARLAMLQGDTATCLREIHEAMDIATILGNPWGRSAGHNLYAQIAMMKGDLKEAEKHARKASALVENTGMVIWQSELKLHLAEILSVGNQSREAANILDKTEPDRSDSKLNICRRMLLRAVLKAKNGRSSEGLAYVIQGLELALQNGYDIWVRPYLDSPAFIIKPEDVDERIYTYLSTLRATRAPGISGNGLPSNTDSGVSLGTAVGEQASRPPPLYVNCLGPMRVKVGDKEIPREAWRNSKAMRIFQYLAVNYDKGFVPKDTLLELVWPDEDPGLSSNRFHVSLSFLRKLLEPDLQRGRPSAYILHHAGGYRLETGPEGGVDVERFQKLLEHAERAHAHSSQEALRRYLKTVDIYRGELLAEHPYEDWLLGLRTQLHNSYLKALTKIMAMLEELEDWARCIDFAEIYLQSDPYAESVYCTLLLCRHALGDFAKVHETFERCEQRIVHTLGFPLSKETVKLYRQLTNPTETAASVGSGRT